MISIPQAINRFEVKHLRGEGFVHPKAFFRHWVPKIYRVYPGDSDFRRACIAELKYDLGDTVSTETLLNWQWDSGEDRFPKYLPAVLQAVHEKYSAWEWHNCLPRREVPRGKL